VIVRKGDMDGFPKVSKPGNCRALFVDECGKGIIGVLGGGFVE
jgi:hypothetical protein